MNTMNKFYASKIIKRMLTEEEFAAFDHAYHEARLPKPFSRWATAQERAEYLRSIERDKYIGEV